MQFMAIRRSISLAHFATRHSVASGRDQCCQLGRPVRYDLLRGWFGGRWACRGGAEMPFMQEGAICFCFGLVSQFTFQSRALG